VYIIQVGDTDEDLALFETLKAAGAAA